MNNKINMKQFALEFEEHQYSAGSPFRPDICKVFVGLPKDYHNVCGISDYAKDCGVFVDEFGKPNRVKRPKGGQYLKELDCGLREKFPLDSKQLGLGPCMRFNIDAINGFANAVEKKGIKTDIGKINKYTETDTLFGEKYETEVKKVKLGFYPQSKAKNSANLESALMFGEVIPTGREYTGGLLDKEPIKHVEYEYEGKCYVRNTNTHVWYNVEPIEWIVTEEKDNYINVESTNVITGGIPFSEDGDDMYRYSYIGQYLRDYGIFENNGFFNEAFNEIELTKVKDDITTDQSQQNNLPEMGM